jgi:hypothetical protein
VLQDAMAATVLARLAVAALDHGVRDALVRHWHEIEAVVGSLPQHEASRSGRVLTGYAGLPARPGSHLRDIRNRVSPGDPLSVAREAYVRQRLQHARAYGALARFAVAEFVDQATEEDTESIWPAFATWAAEPMDGWRDRVGFLSSDRLGTWEQSPLFSGGKPVGTLAERLSTEPHRPPAEIETIGDLLWFAELGDSLARLHGHQAAAIQPGEPMPFVHIDPPEPDEPLATRPYSIALAAGGTAQLVELGGQVPRRCRTWTELLAGLLGDATVAEALTGRFAVPAPLAQADGTVVPGTDVRVEVARTGRQLADWADYMGNCISGPTYADAATSGRSVLVALRGPDDRIVVNAELRPTARGWITAELRARFNAEVDPELQPRIRAWINRLPLPEASGTDPDAGPTVERPLRATRPRPAARVVRDLGDPLGDLAEAAMADPDTAHAVTVMATVAARLAAAMPRSPANPHSALVAMRRATPCRLVLACRLALADPAGPGVAELWPATGDRPLARAVAAMPPSIVDGLGPLLDDAPLPGSLRPLARLSRVAPARTVDIVALRLRRAVGVLLRQDACELAQAVHAGPHGPLIRAAALTVTSWGGLVPDAPPPAGEVTAVSPRRRVRVPGFPASSLRDELWQATWPDATDLGARPDGFWKAIAAHGLLIPSSWLAGGGWSALWARAAARRT